MVHAYNPSTWEHHKVWAMQRVLGQPWPKLYKTASQIKMPKQFVTVTNKNLVLKLTLQKIGVFLLELLLSHPAGIKEVYMNE